jgi:hypothetical protein
MLFTSYVLYESVIVSKITNFLSPISFATALYLLVPFHAIFINISFKFAMIFICKYTL